MDRKHLVVAKYKEDTSWTKEVDPAWDIILYDKDKDVPNVGRDSHTFLYHICLHYHNLADVTVFSQGSYKEHCKDLVYRLRRIVPGRGYTPLSDDIISIGPRQNTYYKEKDSIENCQRKFGLPVTVSEFPYGAFMAVDKENILKRPLSYYLNLLTMVSNDIKTCHELEYMWPGVFK